MPLERQVSGYCLVYSKAGRKVVHYSLSSILYHLWESFLTGKVF